MIRMLEVSEKRAFVRIPNGAKPIDYPVECILSSGKAYKRKKVFALVRTPNGNPHGDIFTIVKNLVRDEDKNIIFFNWYKWYKNRWNSNNHWFSVALALDDSDITQGRNKRDFRFGLVEMDMSGICENRLGLKIVTETIDFDD